MRRIEPETITQFLRRIPKLSSYLPWTFRRYVYYTLIFELETDKGAPEPSCISKSILGIHLLPNRSSHIWTKQAGTIQISPRGAHTFSFHLRGPLFYRFFPKRHQKLFCTQWNWRYPIYPRKSKGILLYWRGLEIIPSFQVVIIPLLKKKWTSNLPAMVRGL